MARKKEMLIGLAVTASILLVLGVIKGLQITAAMSAMSGQQAPPVTVTSFTVSQETWPRSSMAVASLRPVEGATLRAEEAGTVQDIFFNSGAEVEKGDLLLGLETNVEQAQLEGVLAQLELARLNAERQRALRKRGSNSQADLDRAESDLKNLEAEAERIQAVISRKKLIAPFSGRVGIRKINVGDTLSVGDAIVNLNSFEKLYADFSLPQSEMHMARTGARVELLVDAYPEKIFEGTLTARESQIDPQTRQISAQATIINEGALLLPGMFAELRLYGEESDEVLAIPSSSVQFAPYGDSVWVIEEGQGQRPANSQFVQLGRRLGDQVQVLKGLKEGQEVVSSGVFQLRPGVKVIVDNSVRPGESLNPRPENS